MKLWLQSDAEAAKLKLTMLWKISKLKTDAAKKVAEEKQQAVDNAKSNVKTAEDALKQLVFQKL